MYRCDGDCNNCPVECFYGWGEEEEEDDGECSYTVGCQCETCLQNHPEWDVLYGDGEYYNWDDAE